MTEEIKELLTRDNVEMIVKEYDENGVPINFMIKEIIDPPKDTSNFIIKPEKEEE